MSRPSQERMKGDEQMRVRTTRIPAYVLCGHSRRYRVTRTVPRRGRSEQLTYCRVCHANVERRAYQKRQVFDGVKLVHRIRRRVK